ncbi:glycosyl hydrolase family 65 protein [Mycoplasma phocimorsus]|uniref:glycosyl hydrolase family 65 protein n=1 Tax=Mycoplasma phocimorsus TaxID=3045839 RepID=UPI0024BFD42A|nr:glycosyl hydrolase family 65 protein [Mycoplasma phocimorsus]MDJ1648926.1 glycosyl hydrolase family 65 protein [Mycoplasma phocimorsus]
MNKNKYMPKLEYNANEMTITQIGYNPVYTGKTESIFAQGNSYLGIRAVDEEKHSKNKEDFFLAGFYNKGDENEETELANLADVIQNNIYINGFLFELRFSDEYTKTLNLKTGELIRSVIAQRGENKFKFTFRRTVSQTNKHIFVQKFLFEVLEGPAASILIDPSINGTTTNTGIMHFKEGQKRLVENNIFRYIYESTQTKETIIQNLRVVLKDKWGNEPAYNDDNFVLFMARRQIGVKVKFKISQNNPIIIEKLMSVNSTQDNLPSKISVNSAIALANELSTQLKAISYDRIHEENIKEWVNIYKQWNVKIIGDSEQAAYDRIALNFSIYHLNTFVPKYSDQYSVGAKGLSGEGYQGHNYWDTDIFVTPLYTLNNTKIARQLLMYRYHGINGARAKANERRLKGAQYPWETALPDSGEVTPYWGQPDIRTGQQVPIASRAQEIHVSGDVAYAVEQYYKITNDQEFMDNYGYEMIIDTAIWWSERVEWDNFNDQYVITDVMGPNEYKGNIDNNAYINRIAKFNIDLAIEYIKDLEANNSILLDKINKKLPYSYSLDKLIHVSEKIKIQKPNENGLIGENDTFLSLKLNDISKFQMLGDAGKKLFNTQEGISKLSGQLVKQADVVLLNYLFSEEISKEQAIANWDHYEKVTTHDSSLSPSTYAISAIELRHKLDYAYKLFKYAINIDLGDNLSSSDKGIHAGSLAAIYQMIVFGYGGLKPIRNHININPILPKEWDGLEYSFSFREAIVNVSIKEKEFIISSNKEVAIHVNGERYLIKEPRTFAVI